MSTDIKRREEVVRVFRERFGAAPSIGCRAPGRVDLMGSHTDYNLGYVLTLPIDYDTWILARPRADRLVRVWSVNLGSAAEFHLDAPTPVDPKDWSIYLRGVAHVLQGEGLDLTGFDGVVHSTVPLSSGLSSSAALECATATVFEALGGWKLSPVRKALLCQRAENEVVGVNCGILDQYTSCAGREGCALLLDCRDLSSQPVSLHPGVRLVICDTKAKRELAGSEYGERRLQCEEGARILGVKALRAVTPERFGVEAAKLPEQVAKRCRFIVEENARVLELAEGLRTLDEPAIRRLTAESFRGACELYEIGAPAMHAMMKAILSSPGVLGARQAGAGFGGCMVAFVEAGVVDRFGPAVCEVYYAETRITPEVFPVNAAAGAGCLEGFNPGLNSNH